MRKDNDKDFSGLLEDKKNTIYRLSLGFDRVVDNDYDVVTVGNTVQWNINIAIRHWRRTKA